MSLTVINKFKNIERKIKNVKKKNRENFLFIAKRPKYF